MTSKQGNQPPKLTLKQIILSTLGAAIGIQSDAIREKDFQQKSFLPYIIAGVIFTALFIATLVTVVSFVV